MVIKKIILSFLFWLLLITSSFAQQLIAYASVNKSNVYIGEPIELTVSVYSSTWFTSGIDLGNIQIEGAFTVYFRSVTGTKQFSGKNFAGVDFIYNVFPNKEGVITVPVLNINVESPKPGGYKGIHHIIKTKPKKITVKGVPLGQSPNSWLVTTSLNVSEKWSKELKNVKVGDVLQRTISRSAGNTVSEFIPPIDWDSIAGVSIYPKRPSVKTNKYKTYVSSQRTESVNYLFEKEGEVDIPEMEFKYWNPRNKKFYIKKIPQKSITVLPNADLEMLASIKKSLSKESSIEIKDDEKEFLIMGLKPIDFIKYLIYSIFLVLILYIFFKELIKLFKVKHKKYLESETFAFKNVMKSIHKNNYNAFIKSSSFWLTKLNTKSRSLQEFANKYGTDELRKVLNEMNETRFKYNKINNKSSFTILSNEMKKSRNIFFSQQNKKNNDLLKHKKWLNPIAN